LHLQLLDQRQQLLYSSVDPSYGSSVAKPAQLHIQDCLRLDLGQLESA